MSIIPQAFRLTTGDGKIPVIPADFSPAPGEYEVAEITSLTHALTAPHFPQLRSAAAKPFGSTADQRGGGPTAAGEELSAVQLAISKRSRRPSVDKEGRCLKVSTQTDAKSLAGATVC